MFKSLHNDEKGQAIAEMAVCMIAIMAVFLGVVFAFAIGSTNIHNLINCRAEADRYAYSQVYESSEGTEGMQIKTWNEGNDERMFTNDDEAVPGADYDPELFIGQLQTGDVDLVNGLDAEQTPNNFAADLSGVGAVFLESANLTVGSEISDPYDEMQLEDLRGAFSTLFFSSDLIVKNSVYMPVLEAIDQDDVDEEEEDL